MPLTRNLVQINHVPTLGKNVQVFVARLGKGVPLSAIVDQTLRLNGGYQGTVTIATAAAGVYSVSVSGLVIGSYTAIVPDTLTTIRDGLRASLNKNTLGSGIYAGAVGAGTFKLLGGTIYTATVGGPAAGNITVGTIALVTGGATKDSEAVDLFEPLIGKIFKGQYLCFADQDDLEKLALVTGGAAKDSEAVDLFEPLIGKIFKGQYLCFADQDDLEKLALVTVDAVVGATSLVTKKLDEAIAATSLAEFPTYLWDRTDASLDETYANNKTVTFNTGGAQNAVPTTIDRKITLPGEFWHYNAAFRTAVAVADAQEYVYVKRVEPAPNDNFVSGDAIEGRALIASVKRAGQANSPITGDLEVEFSGPTKKSDPVPVSS